MPNSCLVPGCTEKSQKGQKVCFHVLPVRDIEHCKQWLRAINNPTIGEDAGIEMIKGKTICSLHFKLEDYDIEYFRQDEALSKTNRCSVRLRCGPVQTGQRFLCTSHSKPHSPTGKTVVIFYYISVYKVHNYSCYWGKLLKLFKNKVKQLCFSLL